MGDHLRVLIAAGGTAGHVVPALAVAEALRDRGAEVEFAGGERAEAELVPAAGYPLHRLHLAPLDRRRPWRALRALWLALAATTRLRRLIRERGIEAVVGGGGYVSAPAGLAAASTRRPLFLTEADSHLGVANRLLAPFARRVFLAFAIEGRDGGRYRVTGRPVPAATGRVERASARARFGIGDDEFCVLVFGGSQGALSLNEAALEAFAGATSFSVLHACGRRDYPALRERLEGLGSPAHYRLERYIEPFAEALACADLAVARAGGSIFELAAAGLPAILVPYPHATADHQSRNARWMASAGAAVVIADRHLDPARLAREVGALAADRRRLALMARASRGLSRPEAAGVIADAVLAAGTPSVGKA